MKVFAGKKKYCSLENVSYENTHLVIYLFGEVGLISLRLHSTAAPSRYRHDLTSFSRRRDI